jgi:thiol-disulfide isomerase/thioredoxin
MAVSAAFLLTLPSACVPRLTGAADVPYVWTPPSNSWAVQVPPDSLQGEGFYTGEVPHDFRLLDQFGDEVSLWQFYGSIVIVDVSTIWCGPCKALAETTEETYQDLASQGVMYLTVIVEDEHNNPPSQEDLNAWVDLFGITAPVIADPEGLWSRDLFALYGAYPMVLILDRELQIRDMVTGEVLLLAALEEALEG